jgi:hypothetical protein
MNERHESTIPGFREERRGRFHAWWRHRGSKAEAPNHQERRSKRKAEKAARRRNRG